MIISFLFNFLLVKIMMMIIVNMSLQVQRGEESQVNIMGNVNQPFLGTGRYDVFFISTPPTFKLQLHVSGRSKIYLLLFVRLKNGEKQTKKSQRGFVVFFSLDLQWFGFVYQTSLSTNCGLFVAEFPVISATGGSLRHCRLTHGVSK